MQAPALNPDVLDYIMAFSNKKALLNTMLASRDLHRGGIKHLLRDVPRLRNTDQIKCFLVFCDARGQVAETAYRMNYLRGLDLDLGSGYRDKMLQPTLGLTSQALTQFFTSTVRVYAHNFARLTIFRCGDLFDGDLALPLTISSLTTLTYLHLGDATKGSFSLLTSLQSRLVEVNIGMNIDLYEPPGIDITSLLRHSGSSMTIISLYYTSSPTGVACYPLVHTLDACRLHMPTTRHYVTTFPNLQVLNASQCLGRHLEDEEKWTRRRNLNISQQAQAGSWRSLRGYVGSILFLYLFGLACHVTYVSVHDFDYEVMDFGQIWAVVADTQPEHLEIHASTVFSVLDQAADIIALCSSPEFQSLKTFKLGLSLCPGDHNTDMEAMLECIFTAISSSASLIGFALDIESWFGGCGSGGDSTVLGGGLTGNTQGLELSPGRAQVFLESLDVDSVADRLLGCCQSLRAVQVTLRGVTVERGPTNIFFDAESLR